MFKKCKGIILWVREILLVPLRLANAVMLTLAGAWIKEFCGYVEKAISMPLSDWMSILQSSHRGLAIFYAVAFALVLVQLVLEILNVRTVYKLRKKLEVAEQTIRDQKQEVEEARILKDNISSIVKLYLGATSKALKMGVNERISFYILNSDGKSFSILARDSENANLRTYKRDKFDTDEGIIGLAKATGHAFVGGLPDYKGAPKGYIKACKEKFEGLTNATIKNLTMKAQLYYAFRFSSHDHMDYNSVIVVESMNPNFADELALNEVFKPDNEFVYTLVKNFGKYMSTPDIAQKEGL